jgi:hypothetical protein
MLLDDGLLPGLENDRAFVLAPRPVLREQTRPVLPVPLNDDHAGSPDVEHLAARPDSSDQGRDVVDDAGQ